MSDDPVIDEACNCTALRKASRRISLLYDRELSTSGVTSGQYSILRQIQRRRANPPTMSDLAQTLVLDRTALKHALAPLERDGFVVSRADPIDRRLRRIALTPEGEQLCLTAQTAWARAQTAFVQSLGEDRASALRALLDLAAETPVTTAEPAL